MVDRLYYRLKDIEQLWRNIKTRRKLLTYRDKYRDGGKDNNTSYIVQEPLMKQGETEPSGTTNNHT